MKKNKKRVSVVPIKEIIDTIKKIEEAIDKAEDK